MYAPPCISFSNTLKPQNQAWSDWKLYNIVSGRLIILLLLINVCRWHLILHQCLHTDTVISQLNFSAISGLIALMNLVRLLKLKSANCGKYDRMWTRQVLYFLHEWVLMRCFFGVKHENMFCLGSRSSCSDKQHFSAEAIPLRFVSQVNDIGLFELDIRYFFLFAFTTFCPSVTREPNEMQITFSKQCYLWVRTAGHHKVSPHDRMLPKTALYCLISCIYIGVIKTGEDNINRAVVANLNAFCSRKRCGCAFFFL